MLDDNECERGNDLKRALFASTRDTLLHIKTISSEILKESTLQMQLQKQCHQPQRRDKPSIVAR